jgi:hypothetical protein
MANDVKAAFDGKAGSGEHMENCTVIGSMAAISWNRPV